MFTTYVMTHTEQGTSLVPHNYYELFDARTVAIIEMNKLLDEKPSRRLRLPDPDEKGAMIYIVVDSEDEYFFSAVYLHDSKNIRLMDLREVELPHEQISKVEPQSVHNVRWF